MKKAVIVFYSYSGNTQKTANILKDELKGECSVDLIRLDPADESEAFWGQAIRAFIKKEAVLKEPLKYDLSGYDVIALGTPVWAFGMAPALRAYMKKCSGLKDKQVILFTTYGSGAGNNRCINEMKDIVKNMGAAQINLFSVQQFNIKNVEKVKILIKEALKNG